ncbi:hypothetical protein D3C81_2010670 [compost metagenome]
MVSSSPARSPLAIMCSISGGKVSLRARQLASEQPSPSSRAACSKRSRRIWLPITAAPMFIASTRATPLRPRIAKVLMNRAASLARTNSP